MSDIIIVHQFENMIINVFGMHFDFIILHVSTIMEVPLLRLQISPCLKCSHSCKITLGVNQSGFELISAPPCGTEKHQLLPQILTEKNNSVCLASVPK